MDPQPFAQPHPAGTSVTVWIFPGARRTNIVGVHGDAIKIRVEAPPEKGKANQAVARLLEDLTGARAELIRGATSRRKVFLLTGVSPGAVVRALDPSERRSDPK